MYEAISLPDINREVDGITDTLGLQAEVEALRYRLGESTQQLFLERQFAMGVHQARKAAILQSPALRLVYDVENAKKGSMPKSASAMMSSAYGEKVEGASLPDGFADEVTDDLRKATHPDLGGKLEDSQIVNEALQIGDDDPTYSILRAMVSAPHVTEADAKRLRLERYRLTLALDAAKPQFEDEYEARDRAFSEIRGSEWRVRANAATMSVGLLLGSNQIWEDFIHSIVRERKIELITLVNRVQPELLGIQERIAKGKPIEMGADDITTVDDVLERVWSTIKKEGGILPYRPPYQNWLEVLLPAMRLLDPGQRPGEQYTNFEPPIRFVQRSEPDSYYGRSLYDSYIRDKNSLYDKKIYRDKYNY
jgi:hypothetical protein